MAAGPLTQVADLIIPERFSAYTQQTTERKSRLIQSGALVRNPLLDGFLASGGALTFNMPSLKPLDNDADNVSTDGVDDSMTWTAQNGVALSGVTPTLTNAVPKKTGASQEVVVRLSRNQAWSEAQLAVALAGVDPIASIQAQVGSYQNERLQAAFIATINGVIKDNVLANSGDYQFDASALNGGTYAEGVTTFTAENLNAALLTSGDSMDKFSMLMVHSVVYNRMKNNNLIDFIRDSDNMPISRFGQLELIVDDSLPVTGTVYDSWLFGAGAVHLGIGSPANSPSVEIDRYPLAGNGGGQTVLVNRWEWAIHPVGHAYTGSAPSGGPGNGTGSNDLNNSGSWARRFPERKQIRFARLLTKEAA